MSDSCSSKNHFSSLLISDLTLLCSFILSQPLYFSYIIFFSPYLLRLIAFLSPLFVTTLLLLLSFITDLARDNFAGESSQNRATPLLIFLERFRAKKQEYQDEQEFQPLEDLGMYEILFGPGLMEIKESPVEIMEEKSGEDPLQYSESAPTPAPARPDSPGLENVSIAKKVEAFMAETNPGPGPEPENTRPAMEEKRLENFLKILDEFERMSTASTNVEDKKKPPPSKGPKPNKVVQKMKTGALERNGSDATDNESFADRPEPETKTSPGKEYTTPLIRAHSQRITSNNDHNCSDNLGTYGSMRKEKEWKRTLACKLFEERHNVDGGDGMDSLWEAYEMDSNKATSTAMMKSKSDKKNKNKNKNKSREIEMFEDEEIDGQLCCLQALKLSAGKMNLGMGRPNLVKISKAIKGFGWLHSVSKHSKKVHNNNGDRY